LSKVFDAEMLIQQVLHVLNLSEIIPSYNLIININNYSYESGLTLSSKETEICFGPLKTDACEGLCEFFIPLSA
jgi:hypothetical protein